MKNAKYFWGMLFIFISTNIILAQEDEYDPGNFVNNQGIKNTQDLKENTSVNKTLSKWSYSLNMGTNFSFGSFGSFLDVYTAPQINYDISSKWQISAGVLIMNSALLNSAADGQSINQTRAYIMNRASYLANERLRISGEILYGMNNTPQNTGLKQKGEYYFNFDAEYKINDSFSIGIRVSGTNTDMYHYNPFYQGTSLHNRNPFFY